MGLYLWFRGSLQQGDPHRLLHPFKAHEAGI